MSFDSRLQDRPAWLHREFCTQESTGWVKFCANKNAFLITSINVRSMAANLPGVQIWFSIIITAINRLLARHCTIILYWSILIDSLLSFTGRRWNSLTMPANQIQTRVMISWMMTHLQFRIWNIWSALFLSLCPHRRYLSVNIHTCTYTRTETMNGFSEISLTFHCVCCL